jgi:hypothetical protein
VSYIWLGLLLASSAMAAGPEVSRSRGRSEGVVVLWPRVVPETTDPVINDLARKLQERLHASAVATVSERRVDVRPAPERVCPRSGCRGTSLTLLLGHEGGGCALLGIVGPPGQETQRLVPLVGLFQMEDPYLPFRSPPEGDVVITEFVPCDQVESRLDPQALALLLPGSQATPAAPAAAPAEPAAAVPAPGP